MKLPTRRTMIAWTLVVVATVSAINLVVVAATYDLAYLSLNRLEFTVSRVAVENQSTDNFSIMVGITGRNVINFNGLTATQIYVSVYFFTSQSMIFNDMPLQGYAVANKPLAPQGSTPLSVTVKLTPSNATSLQKFRNTSPESVTADTTITVLVSSPISALFNEIQLGNARDPSFQQQQNVTLT